MSGHSKKTGRKQSKHLKNVKHEQLHDTEENISLTQPQILIDSNINSNIKRIDRHSILSKKEQEFIQHILKCCETEDGFDIYQLMAFESDTRNGCKGGIAYFFHIIKSILCGLTQIVGIIVIAIDLVLDGMEEKGLCNPLKIDGKFPIYHLILKLLAFLFSSFLAYFSIDALNNIDKGMYYKMHYAEHLLWLNQIWLRLGFSVNLFVSIVAVYCSFLVIYFSRNSLDMVLNSVALFFIIELDDLLVRKRDYHRIEKFIKHLENDGDNIDINKKCRGCCTRICHQFITLIGWIYTLPFQIVKYITITSCCIIPFFIAHCY